MNLLPNFFGIFRPNYATAEYFCLAQVGDELIGELMWQTISFVDDPPMYEYNPSQLMCRFSKSRVRWHTTHRNTDTLESMRDGETFHCLPYNVSYQGHSYPVLYVANTSWLPLGTPENKMRMLGEDKEHVRDCLRRANLYIHNPYYKIEMVSNHSSIKFNKAPEIPRIVYENHVSAEKAKDSKCPITMNDLKDCNSLTLIKDCFHIFDKDALVAWCNTHNVCPTCRKPIHTTMEF